jgi:hypothetical protein
MKEKRNIVNIVINFYMLKLLNFIYSDLFKFINIYLVSIPRSILLKRPEL